MQKSIIVKRILNGTPTLRFTIESIYSGLRYVLKLMLSDATNPESLPITLCILAISSMFSSSRHLKELVFLDIVDGLRLTILLNNHSLLYRKYTKILSLSDIKVFNNSVKRKFKTILIPNQIICELLLMLIL